MKKAKRRTDTAVDLRQQAHRQRLTGMFDKGLSGGVDFAWAKSMEKEANELIAMPEPPVTSMGEVSQPYIKDVPKRSWLLDTLENGNLINEEASIIRTDLLRQGNLDITALAIDAAQTVKADNSIEKMLAHQLALTHELTMRIGNAAMGEVYKIQYPTTHGNGLEQGAATELQRLVNSVSRLQATMQQGALTLQRLRTGGNQTVTVQHVNVQSGGQAVIGNVQGGGGGKPEGVGVNNE